MKRNHIAYLLDINFLFGTNEFIVPFLEKKSKQIPKLLTTMAKILYSLIAGGDTPLIEANLQSSTNKYVKACRKILKKIARNELRRPDGMATLLSGSFAYNYIHGCDPDDNNATLESLVFLCVTEALPVCLHIRFSLLYAYTHPHPSI